MALPIKDFLNSFLKTETTWKLQLIKDWPKIIGKLGNKVKLEKVQETTLVLSVIDSCWLQELYLLSPILLHTINEKLDQPRIKRLRFKQSEIKVKNEKRETKKEIYKVKQYTLSLTEQKALKRIDDQQLSSALKNFLYRCRQEKE